MTAVLMQRCDEDEAEGGWRVAGFGDTAEEDYLTAKADESEEERGNLVLFKFFKMELYQGGRWVWSFVFGFSCLVNRWFVVGFIDVSAGKVF